MQDQINLQRNNDPLQFKTHVLYVIPNNRVCIEAAAIAEKLNTIYIQNALELPSHERPTWLVGVPTIVDLKQNNVVSGTDALELLKNKLTSIPQFAKASSGIGFELEGGGGASILDSDFGVFRSSSASSSADLYGEGRLQQNQIDQYRERRTNQQQNLKSTPMVRRI